MGKNKKTNITEAINLINSDLRDIFIAEVEYTIGSAIDKAKGVQTAIVSSVITLSQEEKDRIEKILYELLQKRIKTVYRIKPSLLGGLQIRIGDWVVDGSLVNQIDKLKKSIGGHFA